MKSLSRTEWTIKKNDELFTIDVEPVGGKKDLLNKKTVRDKSVKKK